MFPGMDTAISVGFQSSKSSYGDSLNRSYMYTFTSRVVVYVLRRLPKECPVILFSVARGINHFEAKNCSHGHLLLRHSHER